MIHLKSVTPDNWRAGLKVAENQREYVSDDMRLLARAYAYREERSHAYIVYNDNTPVGMALYYDCDELQAFDFSQMFIDEQHQRKGYGRAAAQLIIDEMKQDGKYSAVVLCYIEGNESAKALFESLGFYHTDDSDGNEIVMRKEL